MLSEGTRPGLGGRGYVLGKVFQAFLTLVLILIFNFFLFRSSRPTR